MLIFQNRSLQNIKSEKWKEISGFEGAYAVSSMGRIKSLPRWRACGHNSGYYTTEVIRKQSVRKRRNKFMNDFSYTVGVTLKMDGKSFSYSTARLVYQAFIEDFDIDDKNIVITYKDADGRNLHYKNLVLSTRSAITKKSFSLKRRTSQWQEAKVPVQQLDLDGKMVKVFSSITQAAQETGFSTSAIAACAKGKTYQHKLFRWKYVKGDKESINLENKAEIFKVYLWRKIGRPKTDKTNPIPALNLSPKNLPGEKWKPIDIAEGYYVSNFGRIKRAARLKFAYNVWMKETIKRLIPDGKEHKGRYTSCLLTHISINGQKRQVSVARLVYSHFVKKVDMSEIKTRMKYRNGYFYDLRPQNIFI
ncbi:MAG: hypothetical protein J0I84_05185 [Terrimonas sp.]|nr:hypothetical protein [Terrimonas sp.]OJY97963.1 MAG: hypothetical protein BGP13_09875 [Sphingobacteriales bacterium 40-81]